MTEQEDKDNKTPPEPAEESAAKVSSEELLGWIDAIAGEEPLADMPTMTWAVEEEDVPPSAEGEPVEQKPAEAVTDEPVQDANPADVSGPPAYAQIQAEPLETLEDAIDWLEKLAAGEGTPLEEMPTMLTGPAGPGTADSERKPAAEAAEASGDIDSQIDPVDWLEQLAADQSSPLEELPSVANRLLESEIVSQVEAAPGAGSEGLAPTDAGLADALTYLEALARNKGIDLDAVVLPRDVRLHDLPVRLAELDHLATGEQPTLVVPPPEIMLDSGDTAWHDLSTQMPEDPVEALDWLGRLTGEAELTEAELVAAVEEAVVGSQEGLTRYNDEEPISPEAEEVDDDDQLAADDAQYADAAELPADMPSVPPPIIRTWREESDESSLDSDVLDNMPEDPDEAMVWMETLAGESPASEAAGEAAEDAGTAPTLSAAEAEAVLAGYHERVEAGEDLSQIVDELEKMLAMQPGNARLRRLLGDAYVANGQVDKALAIYRGGLE